MISNKIDATLQGMLAQDPTAKVPVRVNFTRAVPPDELVALGLSPSGTSFTGGSIGHGELDADAIHRLAARDDVHRISYVAPYQPSGG